MSNPYADAIDIAVKYAQLAGKHETVQSENERLHDRVKDLEQQLANAYARIAEMAKVPQQGGITTNPFDLITHITCGTAHGNMTVIDNNPKPTEQ